MEDHYDVVIIGSGAGGGTLAHRLAPSGKKILIIERGDYLRREKDNWEAKAVFLDGKYTAKEKWRDKDGREFQPGIHYFVGGNTKFFGAALLRFRESDFGEVHHHGGISPAWPLSYTDFAPYYMQAERLYSVHGLRGSDPTEPPEDNPYPFPAVSHEPRILQVHDALVRLGHKPFYLPLGIRLDEADFAHSACVRCKTCDGFPCLVNAKADAQLTCVDPALQQANVSLRRNAKVIRLETNQAGNEIAKVHLETEHGIETVSGDIVVSSCGAINSAALLLRSANELHPNGLANKSDQVGRNYMCHNNSALLAVSKEPNPTVFQKTLGVNDFYYGAPDFDFPLGHFQMLGKSEADELRGDAPKFAPQFTLELMASHSLDFWLTSEDLPSPDNRVSLDEDGSIRLSYTPNNLEGHHRLIGKLKSMAEHFGVHDTFFDRSAYLGKKIPIAGCAHQNGTCRFGTDPYSSVLDTNCKTHEIDNLYVVDGSFFVSSTAVNPALTIMANALRVGDHLLDRLK